MQSTGALGTYASFLQQLSARLPRGARISVTSLLDWFRDGTRIGDVLQHVHEFVPQFYDAQPPRDGLLDIAEQIDPARWAPVFNRTGVRYRLGISVFGRIAVARGATTLW